MTKPSVSYVICSAPRTGSTLLSAALTSTNVAGKPNEYFDINHLNEQIWLRALAIRSNAEYVDRVVSASLTANGVFGVKLLWHQLPSIIDKLNASLGRPSGADSHQSLHALLSEKIGEPRYVWLRRRNKLAQAISYYRASRTGRWHALNPATGPQEAADRELQFDYKLIGRYLQTVNYFDARWYDYFRRNRIKALIITYENFVETYKQTVHGVLDFLGIPHDKVTVCEPLLQRQADSRSLDWERRFLEVHKDRREPRSAPDVPQEPEAHSVQTPIQSEARPKRPKRGGGEGAEPPLPLLAYALTPQCSTLVTAPHSRDWMDVTPKGFAHRCLPMAMANQAGWLILNRHKFAVTWNGGTDSNALQIEFLSGENPRNVTSIFGSGILTFIMEYLFRTPTGYNIYVHGPANSPKDGIAALEGIVESDWTEATFTMNWKVTRPHHSIVFEENEPVAMITPIPRLQLERFQPEIRKISDDPELEVLHREWWSSRRQHNAELHIPNSKARQEGWQRHYMRGISIRGDRAPNHQTSLRLEEFRDKSK
jgi:LPS sulfotransferase NodH